MEKSISVLFFWSAPLGRSTDAPPIETWIERDSCTREPTDEPIKCYIEGSSFVFESNAFNAFEQVNWIVLEQIDTQRLSTHRTNDWISIFFIQFIVCISQTESTFILCTMDWRDGHTFLVTWHRMLATFVKPNRLPPPSFANQLLILSKFLTRTLQLNLTACSKLSVTVATTMHTPWARSLLVNRLHITNTDYYSCHHCVCHSNWVHTL